LTRINQFFPLLRNFSFDCHPPKNSTPITERGWDDPIHKDFLIGFSIFGIFKLACYKEAVSLKKPSRRASGHGSLKCKHFKESEPESGSGDFLAGEINHGFLRDSGSDFEKRGGMPVSLRPLTLRYNYDRL